MSGDNEAPQAEWQPLRRCMTPMARECSHLPVSTQVHSHRVTAPWAPRLAERGGDRGGTLVAAIALTRGTTLLAVRLAEHG
jgi:hypothetical protein